MLTLMMLNMKTLRPMRKNMLRTKILKKVLHFFSGMYSNGAVRRQRALGACSDSGGSW